MRVGIVGLGLIGGSMGLDLKDKGFKVYGYDRVDSHQREAEKRDLVHQIVPLESLIEKSDIIVVAVSIDESVQILPSLLNNCVHQTVIDVGSTKVDIVEKVKDHKKRDHFVATHPMAGTEFSGPTAATRKLFSGKAVIYCDVSRSSQHALHAANTLYKALGMHTVKMLSNEHDIHVAFVSHLSHVLSFSLALTVLEKEKNEKDILNLASGGFTSTVRLAKSSPDMWSTVFLKNKKNILEAITLFNQKMSLLQKSLLQDDKEALLEMMKEAQKIRRLDLLQ